jgi:NADH-quinone oxidoreductase subunit C
MPAMVMDRENLKTLIQSFSPEATFPENKQLLEVLIPADKLHTVCLQLNNSTDTAFDYLSSLTAVDWKDHYMMVYHLASTSHGLLIAIKSRIDNRLNPAIDTLSDIWKSANPFEREVFDMFGIRFNNHPDLRRLFMEDDYGFPLRKDFSDPIKMLER